MTVEQLPEPLGQHNKVVAGEEEVVVVVVLSVAVAVAVVVGSEAQMDHPVYYASDDSDVKLAISALETWGDPHNHPVYMAVI